MRLRIFDRRPTLAGSALLALTILFTACAPLLPPPEPADPGPAPPREARPLNGHQLVIAGSEDEIAGHRRQWLQGAGTALAPESAGYFMDVQTARLRQELAGKGVAVERTENTTTITFPGNTSFATNSARLDPAMEPVLGAIARVLNEYRQSLIVVTGHTDNLGDRGHNQRLSEERALAVGQQLLAAGIPPGRMVLIGFGPDRPVTEVDTPEGRALNRRVELIVHPLVEP